MSSYYAAVDIGNDTLKAVFDPFDSENRLSIPNVTAVNPDRSVFELENDVLDGLHVQITSSALKKPDKVFAVGNLATKYSNNSEILAGTKKHDNDQAVVMLLTALAYRAAAVLKPDKDKVNKVTYYLSTGLPLSEAKDREVRQEYQRKLKTSTHEVLFLQTPELEGRKVIIDFKEVLVNVEGYSAYVGLVLEKGQELQGKTLLINDIGGLTTDSAIVDEKGTVDNVNSRGIQQGTAKYLDEIIEKVEGKYGYTIKSRSELVKILTHSNQEERNHIFVDSNRTSIKDITDPVLTKFATEEYNHIKRLWNKVPSIRTAYQFGGGSLLLRPYLEEINQNDKKYNLQFLKEEESIWAIATAYSKILKMWCERNEAAVTSEN